MTNIINLLITFFILVFSNEILAQNLEQKLNECWIPHVKKAEDLFQNKNFLESKNILAKSLKCLPELPSDHRIIQDINNLKKKIAKALQDDDKDEVINGLDKCPDTEEGVAIDENGCPLPIQHRRNPFINDRDRDGTKDVDDICPDEKGYGKDDIRGCPDRDEDGTKDSDDKCPDKKGYGRGDIRGCPDRDKDGTKDSEDKCPDKKGFGKDDIRGCPDRDKDGTMDSDDKCPDEEGYGRYEIRGCPDRDYDGIMDDDDKCPDKEGYGKGDIRGCPDKDKDGIEDSKDKCKEKEGYGKGDILGCPDRDSDGVKDDDDVCPDEYGLLHLRGCALPLFVPVKQGFLYYGGIRKEIKKIQIGTHEVTQDFWKAVMGTLPPKLQHNACGKCPIVYVSVQEIMEFIEKLNSLTGDGYRLPYFSEWLYVAQKTDGNNLARYSGGNEIDDLGWYKENSRRSIQAVRKKDENDSNLYDMTGNVWEIVKWERKFPPHTDVDYCGIGCSYEDEAEICQLTNAPIRPISNNNKKFKQIGFRLVK